MQYGYAPPAPPATDGISIAALVTGLLGTGPLALVLGIVGIRRTADRKRSGRGMAIAGVVLGALATVAWIVTLIVVISVTSSHNSHINALHTACASGDLGSCDSLYYDSDLGSDEERFGNTCGSRSNDNQYGSCYQYEIDDQGNLVDPFASSGSGSSSSYADSYGDDPELDLLWDACEAGDNASCDQLYTGSPFGSEYESFGDSCGGRQEANSGAWCDTSDT